MKCEACDEEKETVEKRRRSTSFVDDEDNYVTLCLACFEEQEEYWKERWNDYYVGRL